MTLHVLKRPCAYKKMSVSAPGITSSSILFINQVDIKKLLRNIFMTCRKMHFINMCLDGFSGLSGVFLSLWYLQGQSVIYVLNLAINMSQCKLRPSVVRSVYNCKHGIQQIIMLLIPVGLCLLFAALISIFYPL